MAKIVKGDFQKPSFFLETAPEISGEVKGILLNKPTKDMEVTIMASNGKYFNSTKTDANGCFSFHDCEFPDSTGFVVNSVLKKGLGQVELLLNKDNYPTSTGIPGALEQAQSQSFLEYIKKADQKYISENGMRMIYLDEVEIKAQRKPLKTSVYYTHADRTMTEEQIEKAGSSDLRTLLLHAGAFLSGDAIVLRANAGTPLLLVNDFPMNTREIEQISASDVVQIDLLKSPGNTAIFNYIRSVDGDASNGVISIHTKRGKVNYVSKSYHIKMITPLGYQKPSEFYSPKYDTPEVRNNPALDLRTTIHWQPCVQSDNEGKASFSFYSADGSASYSVRIEGITEMGKIIQQTGKVIIE